MTANEDVSKRKSIRPLASLADIVCRRAFSSPEAFLYEWTIAHALADVVTPVFASSASGLVLDVGAGGGTVASRLVQEHQLTVVALDPSAAQVRRAQHRAKHQLGLTACQGGAENLPFRDGSFDSVISSCAWKHWPDAARGIDECIRVLKPRGTLTIIEIDGSTSADEFWEFARESRVPWGMKHAYLRFAMRTVVGVAPSVSDLVASFGATPVLAEKIPKYPFNVVRYQAPGV